MQLAGGEIGVLKGKNLIVRNEETTEGTRWHLDKIG